MENLGLGGMGMRLEENTYVPAKFEAKFNLLFSSVERGSTSRDAVKLEIFAEVVHAREMANGRPPAAFASNEGNASGKDEG